MWNNLQQGQGQTQVMFRFIPLGNSHCVNQETGKDFNTTMRVTRPSYLQDLFNRAVLEDTKDLWAREEGDLMGTACFHHREGVMYH